MAHSEWAKNEIERAGLFDKDKDFYGGMTGKSIMELVEVFQKQGHSGMSASIVGSMFHRLVKWKPLTPLTGEDDEWNDMGDGQFQNKRYSAVFKSKERGAYDINAVVFEEPSGSRYQSGTGFRNIEFPYMPPDYPEVILVDNEGNPIGEETR